MVTKSVEKFAVTLVCPEGYIHSLALLEIAETINFALLNLGHDSILSTNLSAPDRRQIILGAHLLDENTIEIINSNAIIYNFEQIDPASPWLNITYLKLLRNHLVWDYSIKNINILSTIGINKVQHLQLGYVNQISRIVKQPIQDIDVLFYGSINSRRELILNQLKNYGLNVVSLFGVYGRERDDFISRSKLVINIHFYESKIFEIARISYLLANEICVLSETGYDPIEKNYANALVFSPYDELIEKCIFLIKNKEIREQYCLQGKAIIQSSSQESMIAKLI
jgi:hypothetical protein